ncbi:MAG TPA: alpha/beta fold hydrolase, partial [Planctomycetota bacterium]|nr:alpha/beta fold hydrolase [Planctomycetota bacterium]
MTVSEGAVPATERRRRRPLRRVLQVLAAVSVLYLVAVAFGLPPASPYDLVINLGSYTPEPELCAPADGKVRLVFLQHGLWRSNWSMWKLERALRRAGYQPCNGGYPSTRARIEQHASLLGEAIEAEVAARGGQAVELAFVGHSLGGLVVQQYLRRPDARQPKACVYLGTPHRGAMLCDLRKRWFVFRWVMGDQAALQLSPADPFHQQPLPMPCPAGTVVGDLGEGNPDIPGPDDGTVG